MAPEVSEVPEVPEASAVVGLPWAAGATVGMETPGERPWRQVGARTLPHTGPDRRPAQGRLVSADISSEGEAGRARCPLADLCEWTLREVALVRPVGPPAAVGSGV